MKVIAVCAVLVRSGAPLHAQTFIMADGAAWDACSGIFHDSGGAGGSYGNNQDLTATLCPSGGAGSGPATSVTFTAWSVQAGAFDQLFIHDGPTTAAPVLTIGNGSNTLLNQTFTATGPSGCLTFRWVSNATVTAPGWTAEVVTGPDAGTNNSISVCSSQAPFSLLGQLGATPDPGGSWTGPGGGAFGGTYNPAVDPGGVYTYTVSGPSPCPDSVATVTIARTVAPNAGTNGTLTACSDDDPEPLIDHLGGTPDAGGTWTAPGGGAFAGTFDPASDPPGVYTYTVSGTPPCSDASATVTVGVNTAPDAGSNGTITVCSNAASFNLFGQLGGSPDGGGAWTGPGGGAVSATYVPGSSTPGVYTYTVNGLPPCTNASAQVTVDQVQAPNAGTNRSFAVCSDDAVFDLIDELGGTPDAGGSWTGPGGVPHGPSFDPATDVSGAYTYTVTGNAPCANTSATLTITVRAAPNAGSDGTITVCSDDASFSLLSALGGTPAGNGTWTDPGGDPFSGTFQPGASQAGVYTYTVTGQAPCTPAVATVTVTVNTAPDAGNNASISICSDDAPLDLFAQLGGAPDAGGSWTAPGGAPHSGSYDPALDGPGAYTYTVTGLAPCDDASAVVTVSEVEAPDAGTSVVISVCSNDGSFSLLGQLGGTPDNTGSWTAPGGGAFGGTFVPGTSQTGLYTYTVPGSPPCSNAVSTVDVSVVQAPDAGTNGNLLICSDDAPVALFGLLGGTPDPGGAWTRPGGTAFGGTYNPSNPAHPTGIYTYTVAGSGPCADATATVQVTETQAPVAGTDGSITVCSTNGPFDLLDVLGGNPDATGTWSDPNGVAVGGVFDPSASLPGSYRYVVPAAAPCDNDTAFATVNVNTAPDAGTNGSIEVCSDDPSFDLITILGGTPDAGGVWSDPDSDPFNGTYQPGISEEGVYTYVVDGLTPCADASAVVVVNATDRPDAGTNAAVEVCSTDASFSLFDELGGTPDGGGSWTAPGGGGSNGQFTPGTSTAGDYTYTVAGSGPCADSSAVITVIVNPAPDAGEDATVTVCEDEVQVDLLDALGGTPDAGGTWTDLQATGQLSGEFFSPLGLAPGNYGFLYTVPGNGQCADATATVTVTIVSQLDAGSNGTVQVCGSNTTFNLFNGLGGSPDPGGVWIDLDATGATFGSLFNASAVSPGTYQFRYLLEGTIGCSSDSATVTVTTVAAPNAGCNGTAVFCSNGPPASLINYLGCSPSPGGIWTRPGNHPFSGVYNPATNSPGVYTYRVPGNGPCPDAIAIVTVSETPAPNAGDPTPPYEVCETDAGFNMTSVLNGNPQTTGTWTDPNGIPHGSTFLPGLDIPGTYLYTVTGGFPCPPDITPLTVVVNDAANAGGDASVTVCSDDPPFLLVDQLNGTPDLGGTWTDPNGDPLLGGTYTPGTSTQGTYTYTVPGDAPCNDDQATVEVFENPEPDAGTSTTVTFCANGPSVNLFTQLGGTPDPTGTWSGPGGPFNGTFLPGSDQPGVYTYTVNGITPCGNATAQVTVFVNDPPNAGCSAAITVCSNDQAFALVDVLTCSPSLNGTWTAPGGGAHNGVFIPGNSPPGTYTYTVPGAAPCANATATVTVSVNTAASAGCNGSVTLCNTSGSFSLFSALTCTPQSGGTWTAPGGGPHSGTFVPSTEPQGVYTYVVAGQAPCENDSATVTVTVNTAPNAGSNGLVIVCDDDLPFTLIDILNGNPALNGSWLDPFGVVHSGIYIPGSSEPGVYTYTVNGQAPCASASASVTVIENEAPDAGNDALETVCSDGPNFQLFALLGGNPDPSGDWYDPNGTGHSGTYDPGSSLPGTYLYVVPAVAPCANDSAEVTIFENEAPQAGISTAPLVCADVSPFPLIDLLAGTPDQNGTWTGPGGVPHNAVFDPAIDVSGTYTYTVAGVLPCPDAVAQVQITLVPAPDAGMNGTLTACVSDPSVDLFNGLGGAPDLGGSWSDDDNTGALTANILDATQLSPGVYTFTYTVEGSGPCDDATATVTVTIADELNAGDDGSAQVCDSQTNLGLLSVLGGSPQSGGTWSDDDNTGALIGGVFDPSQAGQGTFSFTYVLSSAQCLNDTAVATVIVLDGPNAGCDGFVNLCSTSAPFQLINAIGCSPDAGGSWSDPQGVPHSGNGTFLPATDLPGEYLYVVPGIGACPADTARVDVNVTPAPDAGLPNTVTVCSSDDPFSLFDQLLGTPQTGGTWTGPGGAPNNGFYTPGLSVPGVYIYRVTGQVPCADDIASVTVNQNDAPNAGGNNSVAVCSSDAPFSLFGLLTGVPDQGGSWIGPDGLGHAVTFNPAADLGGAYTYVVTAQAPCVNDSATVFVSLTEAPDAGGDGTLQVCVTEDSVNVFSGLTGTPDTTGSWTDLDGTGALSGATFNATSVAPGSYQFQYFLPGNGPCPADSAVVTVEVGTGLSAGVGGPVTICGGITAYDLFQALGGSPDPGGTWSDDLGTGSLTGSLIDASLLPAGGTYPFTYTVQDPNCGDVQATVEVSTTEFPDPGSGGPLVLCSTDGVVDLTGELGGAPDPGSWTNPGGQPFNGQFDPAVDTPGEYVYTVPGTSSCPDTSAVLDITINQPPDAGSDGQLLACDTLTALDLFPGLGGAPQTGGTWSDPGTTGALTNGLVNTTLLPAGSYAFDYTVDVPGCGSDDASVVLTVVEGVTVRAVQLDCNEEDRTYVVTFIIEGGDPGTYAVTGLEGTITEQAPYVFESVPVITSEDFEVIVDDQYGCGAVVVAGSSPCEFTEDVFVPGAFTPNGDGINDFFQIPGIEGFPLNEVIIFNRWGTEVFKATGYDNRMVFWDGTSVDALLPGELPTGTYYYVIDLGNGAEVIKGYVYLER